MKSSLKLLRYSGRSLLASGEAASALRTLDQQLDAGECTCSSSTWQTRCQSGSPQRRSFATQPKSSQDAKEEPLPPAKPVRFVSRQGRQLRPKQRHPIFFPDFTLQMMKISDDVRSEIEATGWTREVAFKTTPNMTKLEIKGILESWYGMQVERVSTINYLGKKRMTYSRKGKQLMWREDDWKKAYVIFKRPDDLPPTSPKTSDQQPEQDMLKIIRDIKLKRYQPPKDPKSKKGQEEEEEEEGEEKEQAPRAQAQAATEQAAAGAVAEAGVPQGGARQPQQQQQQQQQQAPAASGVQQ